MSNLVKAVFGSSKMTTTRPLWQYDHGMVLQFVGVNLPAAYQVHFSNTESGTAKTALGNADGVEIIDEYFLPGSDIYAWVYVNEGDSGHTVYMARIPVLKKALPTDQQPTPVQQTAIEDAIDALNEAAEGVPLAINTALAEAKASGEFDGDPGEDGFSPAVTITPITGGHRVTITDEEHPSGQSFDVMDGSGGSGTVDDAFSTTSTNPVQNKVITNAFNSASQQLTNLAFALDDKVDKVSGKTLTSNDFTDSDKNKLDDAVSETWVRQQGYITGVDLAPYRTALAQDTIDAAQDTAIAAKYTKPSSGIPKTDLASAVQTSLGKADTALQSYTETDPTVPSWAKAANKPRYTASEVGAIAAPSSPATGAFLVWNGSAWVAQTLSAWNGGSY